MWIWINKNNCDKIFQILLILLYACAIMKKTPPNTSENETIFPVFLCGMRKMDDRNRRLDRIARLYYHEIFLYCRGRMDLEEDAYDLTQEIFLALIARIATIHQDRVRKWLYATANHKVADFYRLRQRLRGGMETVSWEEYHSDAELLRIELAEECDERDIMRMERLIMAALSEEETRLLRERCREKLDYRALSALYGVGEPAMRKRVSRLKKKIRNLIVSMRETFPEE